MNKTRKQATKITAAEDGETALRAELEFVAETIYDQAEAARSHADKALRELEARPWSPSLSTARAQYMEARTAADRAEEHFTDFKSAAVDEERLLWRDRLSIAADHAVIAMRVGDVIAKNLK